MRDPWLDTAAPTLQWHDRLMLPIPCGTLKGHAHSVGPRGPDVTQSAASRIFGCMDDTTSKERKL